MEKNNFLSIGEICHICDLAPSALRYYDKVGVIKPAYVDNESGYRYFNADVIPRIVMLRYYQSLGFSLNEIKSLLGCSNIDEMRVHLLEQEQKQDEHLREITMVKDRIRAWLDMINEAKIVLNDPDNNILMRYIEARQMLYCDPQIHSFTKLQHIMANTDFVLTAIKNKQTTCGPLYVRYPSITKRLEGDLKGVRLMARCHQANKLMTAMTTSFGGFQAVCAYHKGSIESLRNTYEKMLAWADKHRFELQGTCVERFINDIWLGGREEQYIIEIIMPVGAK